jgi:hypothetical protein
VDVGDVEMACLHQVWNHQLCSAGGLPGEGSTASGIYLQNRRNLLKVFIYKDWCFFVR